MLEHNELTSSVNASGDASSGHHAIKINKQDADFIRPALLLKLAA